MEGQTLLDILVALAWVLVGLTLIVVVRRQARNFEALSEQLRVSEGVLNECRSHLLIAAVNLRDVAAFGRAFQHMSLELRKPLGALATTAWLIKEHAATDPTAVRNFSDSVIAEAGQLGEVVDRMLDMVETEAVRVDRCVGQSNDWDREPTEYGFR
jgi:signal transduction histidine kinase